MTGVTFDMAQVLWCLVLLGYLGSIDPSSWMASPTTALVFLWGLGLRLISGGGGIELSDVFVLIRDLVLGLPIGILFVLFRQRAMVFWAPRIDIPNIEGRLQVSLCLYITCLLHHFLPCIWVSFSMVQLGSNGQTESLLEVAYQGSLIRGTSEIELF